MRHKSIVLYYLLFGLLATLSNLATQRLVLNNFMIEDVLVVAMFLGTLVGLIVKYFLDKKWIFFDKDTSLTNNGRKFVKYAALGIITTGFFWMTEMIFWLYWRTDLAREIGAVIGLVVGYSLKYRLDERFVFREQRLDVPT